MNAHTREQPADPSSTLTYPHYGPLLTLEHLAGRHEPLSVALSQSHRRTGCRVYCDAARVAKAINAELGRCPASCAKEAIACTQAGGVG